MSNHNNRCIIILEGLPGVGKTTLLKHIDNTSDVRVLKENFLEEVKDKEDLTMIRLRWLANWEKKVREWLYQKTEEKILFTDRGPLSNIVFSEQSEVRTMFEILEKHILKRLQQITDNVRIYYLIISRPEEERQFLVHLRLATCSSTEQQTRQKYLQEENVDWMKQVLYKYRQLSVSRPCFHYLCQYMDEEENIQDFLTFLHTLSTFLTTSVEIKVKKKIK